MISAAGGFSCWTYSHAKNVLMYSGLSNLSIFKSHSVTADSLKSHLLIRVMDVTVSVCFLTPARFDRRKTLVKELKKQLFYPPSVLCRLHHHHTPKKTSLLDM